MGKIRKSQYELIGKNLLEDTDKELTGLTNVGGASRD